MRTKITASQLAEQLETAQDTANLIKKMVLIRRYTQADWLGSIIAEQVASDVANNTLYTGCKYIAIVQPDQEPTFTDYGLKFKENLKS